LTAVRIERQTAGREKGDGLLEFVVSHISTYYERWVAQVWIFRPGKLYKPELERTKNGGLGFIVSPISESRCGPPNFIGQM
jgi:hypothetical protein